MSESNDEIFDLERKFQPESGFIYPRPGPVCTDKTLNAVGITSAVNTMLDSQEWGDLVEEYARFSKNRDLFVLSADYFAQRYADYSADVIQYNDQERHDLFNKDGLPKADWIITRVLPQKRVHDFLNDVVGMVDRQLQKTLAEGLSCEPERNVQPRHAMFATAQA